MLTPEGLAKNKTNNQFHEKKNEEYDELKKR